MTQTELTEEDKEKLAELLETNRSHGNHRYEEQERAEDGRYV